MRIIFCMPVAVVALILYWNHGKRRRDTKVHPQYSEEAFPYRSPQSYENTSFSYVRVLLKWVQDRVRERDRDSELVHDGVGGCGWDRTKVSVARGTCSEERAKVGSAEGEVCEWVLA